MISPKFDVLHSPIEASVIRGETTMKSSSQKQHRETNLTYTNSGREGLASQKMGCNLLRFLSILMAAVFLTLTGSLTALAADPVAVDDAYTVNEDQTLTVPADGVLSNDTDADFDLLSVSEVDGAFLNVGFPTATANGTVTLNSNGSFTYTPSGNFYGTDSFNYTVSDGMLGTDTATVTITVTSVNDVPTISDIGNQTIAEEGNTGALSFTVGDVETPVASLTLSGSSGNTTLVPNGNIIFGGSGATRTVLVTPAADQFGTALITVTVTDADTGTASDTFTVTVTSVNDVPTISDISDHCRGG